MEHSSQNYILDNVVRNHSGTFDIILSNLEFQKFNIKNISLSLKNPDGVESDLLENCNYRIYTSSSLLFYGKFESNVNIFKYTNIPFSKLYLHKLVFVLLNINKETIEQILHYIIEFKWTESNNLFANNDFIGFSMKWSFTKDTNSEVSENNQDTQLFIRFAAGMLGASEYFENYSENFIESNKNIYSSDETNVHQIINYNHLKDIGLINFYELELDVYSDGKLLKCLSNQTEENKIEEESKNTNVKQKFYEAFSETYKIPIQKIIKLENNFEYKSVNQLWALSDAFSNVCLLCDNSKYTVTNITLINKVVTDFQNNIPIQTVNTFDLEFVLTDFGYKISGLSEFLIIPNILNHSVILEINFSTHEKIINSNNLDELFPIDFWIKLDRYCIDSIPRKKMFKDKDNYSEYPIVDLVDYLSENGIPVKEQYLNGNLQPNNEVRLEMEDLIVNQNP